MPSFAVCCWRCLPPKVRSGSLYAFTSYPLLSVLHVRAEGKFPNSNHFGLTFDPLVSVVVCHAICSDPAWYELIPRSDLRSSDDIEQPSLSWESFANIIMCYARLGRSLCGGISERDRFCQHQIHWSNYPVPSLCRCFCSIVLYGLVLFYCLMKEELAGSHPLSYHPSLA